MTRRQWRASAALSALLAIAMFLSPRAEHPIKLQTAAVVPVSVSGASTLAKEELRRPRPAQTTTTTAPAPRPASQPVSRGVPRSRTTPPSTAAPAPAQTGTPDFWRRLSNCESSTGRGGNGGGFFQFSPDTALKVGYRAGQSYATQLLEAQAWAAKIHPNEGGRSGWPHCWWVALRG